jgi:hypothetical protein
MMKQLSGATRALWAVAGGMLSTAALAGSPVITFEAPPVTNNAHVYEWDDGADGTVDIRFVDLTGGGFFTAGPGTSQKFVNTPGLEGGLVAGPEIRVDFISNWGSNQGIYGPFKFGFVLNTTLPVPTAVSFSIYDKAGFLLGANSAPAFLRGLGGGLSSSFSEGMIELSTPFGIPHHALIDVNHAAPAGRYMIDNFNYVPEPAAWAMMIVGFGLVGHAMRQRSRSAGCVAA